MVEFSDDTTLYGAIGGGVVLLLVLLCCCCWCRKCKNKNKNKKNATDSELTSAATATATVQTPVTGGRGPQKQNQYAVVDVADDPAAYRMMPTSPLFQQPPSNPLQYHHHHKTVMFADAPVLPQVVASPVTTTANSLDRSNASNPERASTPLVPRHSTSFLSDPTAMRFSSAAYNAAADPLAIADDPAIVASRLPFETITALVLISKGGFGEVYKGSYRGSIVALKRLLPETRRDLKQIASFLHEVKLMASMEHPHIVRFLGVAWDSFSDISVVIEYMDGGDLRAALTQFNRLGRPLGFDKQKATLALHVAHALTYMHSLQPVVLHRDFKSKNILLNADQTLAKITDFGVSRERSDQTMTAGVGTLLWMAPEVMAGDRYDDKADVFSFGIVLSELDTYNLPYADIKARLAEESGGRRMPDTALLQRIMAGRLTVTFSPELREDVRALGMACVALDPQARPTAAQVLYELQKIERTMDSEISIVL